MVDVDDLLHGVRLGEADVVEETAAEKGVRQLLLVVRGDEDDRPLLGPDGLLRLVDVELHAVEFQEQVVGEFDVRLVDLVDQEDRRVIGLEGVPQLALLDVVLDVLDPLVAELAVAQTADGVIFIEPLLGPWWST